MLIKGLVDEDFVNYKKPSMFIAFPTCSWKCEYECGRRVCQNSTLATFPSIRILSKDIVKRYMNNQITNAIVIGGLEPFDSLEDLRGLIHEIRLETEEDVVIYTGYTEEECTNNGWIANLKQFGNIIIKFGRFVPDEKPHYDEVLGINLASDNQYAKKIC